MSKVFSVEKKYISMEGPSDVQRFTVGDGGPAELLWITAFKTEIVDQDGQTASNPELMCHMNIDLDTAKHQALLDIKRPIAQRLMTLSQGMLSQGGAFEAKLPDGFGFPIVSNEPINLNTQVLNHNIEHPNNLKVRHRVTIEYIRDADLKTPIKPLFNLGASGTVLLADNKLALPMMMPDTPGEQHGPSCLMAPRAPNAAGMSSDYVDPQGRKVTGHWVVPPGKQVNHSDITWFMGLPFDTKLHYAAVHLHPFAQSIAVRDVTADKTIFTAVAKNPEQRVGLAHVDTFISTEGVPLYRDHKYELVSVYFNPTDHNVDSMASVFLALDDPSFVKPTPTELALRASDLFDSTGENVLFTTSRGDLGMNLLRVQAPKTAKQFVRLMHAGAFDHAAVTKATAESIVFTAALTPEQQQLVVIGPPEAPGSHASGTMSMCVDPAKRDKVTLVLHLQPTTDTRCTVFAKLGPGANVALAIANAPADMNGAPVTPVELTKARLLDGSNGDETQTASSSETNAVKPTASMK